MIYVEGSGWLGQVIVPITDEIELGWRVLFSLSKPKRNPCYCPDDCNCRYPWRANYCGCQGHTERAN